MMNARSWIMIAFKETSVVAGLAALDNGSPLTKARAACSYYENDSP